jgi:hypothetical protein
MSFCRRCLHEQHREKDKYGGGLIGHRKLGGGGLIGHRMNGGGLAGHRNKGGGLAGHRIDSGGLVGHRIDGGGLAGHGIRREEEEERSSIKDLKRYARLAIAWAKTAEGSQGTATNAVAVRPHWAPQQKQAIHQADKYLSTKAPGSVQDAGAYKMR